VSKREDRGSKGKREIAAFDPLENAVQSAVAQLKELRGRLDEAQREGRETKELLRKFTGGEEDPAHLLTRLSDLESQNRDLQARIEKGREGVERLLARIRFLEEQG